jgi:hypothetical protein
MTIKVIRDASLRSCFCCVYHAQTLLCIYAAAVWRSRKQLDGKRTAKQLHAASAAAALTWKGRKHQ